MNPLKFIPAVFVLVCVAAFTTAAQVPKPLLEYHLDETGTLCVSVGSAMLPLTLLDANRLPADLHSADGGGLSGVLGDRAFDNSSASGMGGVGKGGVALVSTNLISVGAFHSFTLQCWFNASAPLQNGARLFDSGNYGVFAGRKAGVVWLGIDRAAVGTPPVYHRTNQWIFFAVTYDGTQRSNNVAFYYGTKDSPVELVGIPQTLNKGAVTNRHAMGIGNLSYDNVRPFMGQLDGVRIFADSAGDAGVLTQAQLESLRQSDVQQLPSVADIVRQNVAMAASKTADKSMKFSHAEPSPKGFNLSVQTVLNTKYAVLWSTNLVDWQTFTNFTGDGQAMSVHDTRGLPNAFYRVQTE
jgi:hypothetical protein